MPKPSPSAARHPQNVGNTRRSPPPSKAAKSSKSEQNQPKSPKSSSWKGIVLALGTSAAVAAVTLSGSAEAPVAPRSPAAAAAEADTRALLDERTALHLHRLRP